MSSGQSDPNVLYREAKEQFVSRLEGGSLAKINAASLTALTTYLLWAVLQNRGILRVIDLERPADGTGVHRRQQRHATWLERCWTFVVEAVILVVPLLLACTILSEHLAALNAALGLISAAILATVPDRIHAVRRHMPQDKRPHWSQMSDDEEDEDEEKERQSVVAGPSSLQTGAARAMHRSDVLTRDASIGASSSISHTNPSSRSASGSSAKIVHRSSPSLARSAAPRPDGDEVGIDTPPVPDSAEAVRPSSYVPRNQPFLTVYRAHMMLMTIICILAVDFTAFPREFAKCETWGTSLMDLGVGSFVFSLGLISASPLLRSPSQRFKPMRIQLWRDIRRALPLLALGMVRVIMVKGVEYPEHVSEYGVHWNFFLTLACLPFLGTFLRPMTRVARFSTVGLAVSLAHQLLLSMTEWGEWASSNDIPRLDLLSQNKEGITSLPGYLAVFLLGLDLGHYVLPRDPYLAYRRPSASRQRQRTDTLAMVLISYAILWWSSFYLVHLPLGVQVSRRLANLPYVLWIAAYNTAFLWAYVLIYMVFLQPLDGTETGKAQGKASASGVQEATLAKAPLLLEALNSNAFAVFLIANLLTGLVNLTIQTMYASHTIAVAVLLLYLTVCLGFTSVAHWQGWRIKI